MANLNIYLDAKEEIKIKKLAQAEGKSISQYCREKITDDKKIEQPIILESIENEINSLRNNIIKMNNNIINLSKLILRENQMNSKIIQGFFDIVIEDDETKSNVYEQAKIETEEFMSKYFEE